jgi:transposase
MMSKEEWLDMKSMDRNQMNISAIARRTGHDRKTVRKYIMAGNDPPKYRARPRRPSILDPYKEYVRKQIDEHDLSAVRLLEDLQKMGYKGGYSILRDYAKTIRKPKTIQAVLRYETAPGRQAQVDWSDVGPQEIDGGAGHLYAFSMVLGYSRAKYLEHTLDCKTETFIRCHLNAFAHFGGCAREILYDNTKNVVLKRALKSSESKWNPLFEDFFRYIGFTPRLCRPYRAATKGKIERAIRFERDNFLKGRRFSSLQELNSEALAWARKVDSRPHGTTGVPPLELLEKERPELLQVLDRPPYQIVQRFSRRVSSDCFVCFMGNKYSVPWKYARREATLLVQDGKMRVEVGGELACEHEVRAGPGHVVKVKEHFAGLYKEVCDHNLLVHEAAQSRQSRLQIGPVVEERPLAVYDQFLGGM